MKKKCASSWFFLTMYSTTHGYENVNFIKKKIKCNTGWPLYPRIQYPWFQLSAVYRAWKKIWKINEIKGS